VQTAGVLIRTEVMRGRLTISQGQQACARLITQCSADERVRWIADKTDRKLFCIASHDASRDAVALDAEGGVSVRKETP